MMVKAEYAEFRGVSRQTVYAWIARGERLLSSKKIDLENATFCAKVSS